MDHITTMDVLLPAGWAWENSEWEVDRVGKFGQVDAEGFLRE